MRIVFVHGQGRAAVCRRFKENVHKPKPLQTLYILIGSQLIDFFSQKFVSGTVSKMSIDSFAEI